MSHFDQRERQTMKAAEEMRAILRGLSDRQLRNVQKVLIKKHKQATGEERRELSLILVMISSEKAAREGEGKVDKQQPNSQP